MRLLEFLKQSFITRKCVICDEPIDYERRLPICNRCNDEWLQHLDKLCIKCGYDCDYCTCVPPVFARKTARVPIISCVFYIPANGSPVNNIVFKLKREYMKNIVDFCAELMKEKTISVCKRNNIDYRNFAVTYPTRRKSGKIKYGYDHTELLAKAFAKKLGIECIKCFENVGKSEQKSLGKGDRVLNAAGSYRIKDISLKNKNFFLVDDIITTGATAKVCMELLRTQGANTVIPVVYAKDTKTE